MMSSKESALGLLEDGGIYFGGQNETSYTEAVHSPFVGCCPHLLLIRLHEDHSV